MKSIAEQYAEACARIDARDAERVGRLVEPDPSIHHLTSRGTACGVDARDPDVYVTTATNLNYQHANVSCPECRAALGLPPAAP
jgi:hypothetical protein